ncbi:MAG: Z1 domain-containing protein [Bacteroidales bacterium]|nr:Z1 domain-containing protein [Bacteroidales bacterium]
MALIKESSEFKSELLINIDIRTPSQQEISKILKKDMRKIKEYISLYSESKPLFKSIMNRFSIQKDEQSILIEKVKFIIDYFTEHNQKNIFLLNCESDDEFTTGNEQFSIIIGGNLISRGFTFDNLTTELIINSPIAQDSLDTLLQRAR